MRATRRSQPYRKGSAFRRPGLAFKAMKAGRTAYGRNPMDRKRRLVKTGPLGKRRRRRKAIRARF